jgi:hypothetical protein
VSQVVPVQIVLALLIAVAFLALPIFVGALAIAHQPHHSWTAQTFLILFPSFILTNLLSRALCDWAGALF